MKKVCSFCGNKNFEEKSVQYIYRRDDRYLLVNNVPCEECEYCGERYSKAVVLKKVEKDFHDIYSSGKRVKKQVKMPVEDFVEI